MSIAIVTSTSHRHYFFAVEIAKHFDTRAVFLEPKTFKPQSVGKNEEENEVLERWFSDWAATEKNFFGDAKGQLSSLVDQVAPLKRGEINSDDFIKSFKALSLELLIVFGSSILRPEVFQSCSGAAFNLHLGISPFYRGSATNFWAIYDGRPGYVGATIHLLDSGIDSGPIVRTGRPQVSVCETPHSLGCKAIQVGTKLMIESITEYFQGGLKSKPQTGETMRLCKRRDFSAQSVRQVERHVSEDLFAQFIAEGAPGPASIVPINFAH